MRKTILCNLLSLLLAAFFVSCEKSGETSGYQLLEDDIVVEVPEGGFTAKVGEVFEVSVTSVSDEGVSYQWNIDGTMVAETKNLEYTFETSGEFALTLVASQGDVSFDYDFTVTVEDVITADDSKIEVTFPEGRTEYIFAQNQTLEIPYKASYVDGVTVSGAGEGWSAELDAEAGVVTVKAPMLDTAAAETCTLTLEGIGIDGNAVTTTVPVRTFSYDLYNGVFVLNEGNMTTENGSLVYVSPDGYVVDDAYFTTNGTHLGNVCQDMFIYDNEIYVISQNGDTNAVGTSFDNDGMLVIMDAKTMKKTDAFTNADLSELQTPTHVAVLDRQHIYIRDKKGIWRLDRDTRALTFVTDSDDAGQSRMAVVNGKVYSFQNTSHYMTYVLEISADSDTAQKISIWDINSTVAVKPADDGTLWVLGVATGSKYLIGKLDVATKSYDCQTMAREPAVGNDGAFSVIGNTIYYQDNMILYSFDYETAAETVLVDMFDVDENSFILYNSIAANPVDGKVYVNMISSYSTYDVNTLWAFDFTAGTTPVARYDNFTRFPAGVYFTEEFK